MTIHTSTAGILVYLLNGLSVADGTRSTTDIARASESESGLIDLIVDEAKAHGLDASIVEHAFTNDAAAKSAVNDMYARWVNASETGSYLLPNDVNGWLWLSSISIDAFFIAKDSEVRLS